MTRESPVSPETSAKMGRQEAMVTIGVDAHKGVHVAVALDEGGRELSCWRGPNSHKGWKEVYRWAAGLGQDRRWGIEGARKHGRGLAQYLVASGETVYEINTRWTAMSRKKARRRAKSGRIRREGIPVRN